MDPDGTRVKKKNFFSQFLDTTATDLLLGVFLQPGTEWEIIFVDETRFLKFCCLEVIVARFDGFVEKDNQSWERDTKSPNDGTKNRRWDQNQCEQLLMPFFWMSSFFHLLWNSMLIGSFCGKFRIKEIPDKMHKKYLKFSWWLLNLVIQTTDSFVKHCLDDMYLVLLYNQWIIREWDKLFLLFQNIVDDEKYPLGSFFNGKKIYQHLWMKKIFNLIWRSKLFWLGMVFYDENNPVIF